MARGEMSVFEWIAMSEALGADGLEFFVDDRANTGTGGPKTARAIMYLWVVSGPPAATLDFTNGAFVVERPSALD